MFKFLKDKLKKSVNKLSEDIEKEAKEETLTEEEVVEEEKKKPGFFSKLFKKKETKGEDVSEYEPEELFDDKKVEEDIREEYKEVVEEASKQEVTAEKVMEKVEEAKQKAEEGPKPSAKDIVEEVSKEIEKEKLKEDIEEAKEDIKEAYSEHDKEKVEGVKEKVEKVVEEGKEFAEDIEKDKKEDEIKERIEDVKDEIKRVKDLEPEEEGKGFFGKIKQKIVTKKINEKQFDEMFWDMELVLLENNVAVEVIDKIKKDLREFLVDRPIRRGKVESTIMSSLRHSLEGLFDVEKADLIEKVKCKKPYVICFVGINGSGKTTTIAKMCQLFKDHGLKCVMAAADTFRAAAIQQLEEHAKKLNVKIIKQDYGSDAAAVAFDAVKYAEAHHIDVVLIDTAGRMHSNANLVDEMKKIIRVAKPDMKIFVGESITGNDCVEQAAKFNEAIGIDGIVLSKADVDEKGGAAISVSYVTKKPILYLGVGQEYKDLQRFDSGTLLESLGL